MRVLIADDDVQICEYYRALLQARGHDVILSHDGGECVKIYNEELQKSNHDNHAKTFDVVILDYKMPYVDGLTAAKEILRINRRQRIVFASAYVKESLLNSANQLENIVQLIQKPFEGKIFVDLIEDTCAARELEEINKLIFTEDDS